ncbi:MAG: hypothetical protein PWQ79_1118 [Thermococcaceae archaeon]|nr:hypothetical protein [Thermococcaceae archaeon]
MTAETYENDKYTPEDILSNEYLLFHELVEIECLKRKGLRITPRVIMENPEKAYECHLKALEEELRFALNDGNIEWVKRRLNDIKTYLSDPFLPEWLKEEPIRVINEFGKYML